MANPFSVFTGANNSTLTNALLALNSGINIVNDPAHPINLISSGIGAVNFYDGSLAALDIGAGLLLTSGTTPGTSNTVGWFGDDNSGTSGFDNGDADINAVVNTVFQTQSYDATTLSFSFTVSDPTATSISFDLVFGSDEYPEWVDQFVDSAIVMVNGVNYALFNHDPNHPLSVVSANLAAGYFQDNTNNVLPIEYDGVSHLLKIVAPIQAGINTLKIGIADTGDHIYDSGIFIANLSAGTIPGSGVVITPGSGTDNSDTLSGSSKDEYFDLKNGDDTCYAGAGDDIVVAGAGNDTVYGGSGNDETKGDAGDDFIDGGDGSDTAVYAGISSDYSVVYNSANASFTLTDNKTGAASEGTDTLSNIELVKFSDGLFSLGAGGLTVVTPPPPPPTNTPGSVVILGVGSVGNTLTALVSDPDGIQGAVTYLWESSSDGTNWNTIGGNLNAYAIQAADVGSEIRVTASYEDNGNLLENPVSAAKAILNANTGDLNVTLLNLTAPAGTSVINPLTTLLKDAIDLGISPNVAVQYIKDVLQIPASVNLQTYDAWAVLQSNPNDATALQVEKVAVQIAILTSLSDDDSGMKLTLAVLNAAQTNATLDLGNLDDLSNILGIPAVIDPDTGKYPEPLNEIHDRNSSLADAVADGQGINGIEQEWQDLLSIQEGINSTSIADLSIHVNQAPAGSPIASLAAGTENTDYSIAATDLLAGYSDPDNDGLSVDSLIANTGGTLIDNADGTWTFIPDANYSGPVELSYSVIDGQGGSTTASQMFVIAASGVTPDNQAPTVETAPADQSVVFGSAFDFSLPANTFQDPDAGDVLTLGATLADGSPLPTWLSFDSSTGTFTGTPTNADLGNIAITVTATDNGGLSASAALTLTVSAYNPGQVFIATPGNDSFVGSPAIETVTYGQSSAAVTVSLVPATAQNTLGSGLDTLIDIDNLIGSDLNDKLTGNLNDNVLDGGAGTDTLSGGGGNDTYVVDTSADKAIESGNAGTDTVLAFASYTLGVNVENLVLMGQADLDGTGNSLANVITGNSANNVLNGGGGADNLSGGEGDDTYMVDNIGDVIVENPGEGTDDVNSTVTYTLSANVENLTLTGVGSIGGTGNADANVITGNSGNNILDGGLGADSLIGGLGNDTYLVDEAGDSVSEYVDEGTDLVKSSIDYALGNDVENLTLTGSALYGTGNDLANTLTGNADNNVLDGGAGNDRLVGGLGDDTYIVDSGTDIVTEAAGAGTDTVLSSASAYTLSGNVENLVLTDAALNGTGNSLANVLTGNSGNNLLNGGGGADSLNGGEGDDTYVVDNVGDTIIENAGEGNDSVNSSVSYTLAANVENLTLTGSGSIKGTGNADANVITGNSGNNILDGGIGADTLVGGLGNDTYFVDDAGDQVVENPGEGTDLVKSAISFDLSTIANVENLTLTGSADIDAAGDAGDNIITGNSGNNVLTGGDGVDRLIGGGGNDTFIVNITAAGTLEDIVIAGTGIDTLKLVGAYEGMATTLTVASTIENYDISGTGTLQINVTGNSLANAITGNGTDNILIGGGGADVLTGGAGDDTYGVDNLGDTIVENAEEGIDSVNSSVSYTLSANVENLTLTGAAAINGTGNDESNTLTGNMGKNVLDGGAGNDLLIGGKGQDTLSGGADSDTFAFAAGHSGTSAASLDLITDFAKGAVGTGDLIDYTAALAVGGSNAAATAALASINQTTGEASFFAGSGTTLADALADIANGFTSAGNAAGEFAFFKVNGTGDEYAFISDGVAGVGANDVVIQLVGISSIGAIDLFGGNLTITS